MRATLLVSASMVSGLGASMVLGLVLTGPPARPAAHAASSRATIEDFMLTVHGKGGLMIQLKTALKTEPEDDEAWKAVHARVAVTKNLVQSILARRRPKEGSDESWKKLVTEYYDVVKQLYSATSGRKSADAMKALRQIDRSCRSCHDEHQP